MCRLYREKKLELEELQANVANDAARIASHEERERRNWLDASGEEKGTHLFVRVINSVFQS